MFKKAIVVGSGIAGIATAYSLLAKGYVVTVLDKNPKPVGASIRNFGMIWPIGQPSGTRLDLAMKSRQIWIELSRKSNFQLEQNGSLHLAYQSDEQNLLFEFMDSNQDQRNIRWLSYSEVTDLSPAVITDELIGAMHSVDDMLIDPREAISKLIAWLQNHPHCTFHFNTPVIAIQDQTCVSPLQSWTADQIFVCTGSDIDLLFPEVLKANGITCDLQMMRTDVQPTEFKLGPSLCGGLTLAHYAAFQGLPSLELLKSRLSQEYPDLLQHGIHVMAAQNQDGEITIGDSHHYNKPEDPFIDQSINEKILSYLSAFCQLPDTRIKSYWKGRYFMSNVDQPYLIQAVSPYCQVVNCFGGGGMTLAFGIMEKAIAQL